MNSQEIVDYVMNTPSNTNPAILKQMIDANSSGGSSGVGFDFVLHIDYPGNPDNMWVDGDLDKVFSRLEKDCNIGLFVGYCVFTGEGYTSGISAEASGMNLGDPDECIKVYTNYETYQVARDGTVTID